MIFPNRIFVPWRGFSFKYYSRTPTINQLVRQFQSLTAVNQNLSRIITNKRSHYYQIIRRNKGMDKEMSSNASTLQFSSSAECPYKKSCDIGVGGECECVRRRTFCDNQNELHFDSASIGALQWTLENDYKQSWDYSTPPPPASQSENGTEGQRKTSFLLGTMNQPLTVCVEGNIGSGKTTFLKYFKKYPEVCVFDEPISKWRDCQGYNLLDLMYKDPRKWSLCFQSYVQLTMLDLHTKPIVQPIKMMERSIFSAQYCFVQNLRDEGLMEDPQYAVLSEWFNFSMTNLPIKVDLIVYLRTDPEIAYKRIGQRGRSEENSIKLEYLQSVHKHHEDWLVHNQKLLPCPVLTIDANTELADMTLNYQLCEEKMFQKVAVAN